MELPTIRFRGERWYVDYRLKELRRADCWDLTPLSFDDFERQASLVELESFDNAIMIYRLTRGF